ncbi:zinc finger protein-like 1 homolog [Condylostylus longicornis]|uniref:zinc finger protein-like 1 homolog n=1 Tax=Condylostylus longicornis TaxID=2530218 RepID=UPI00244E2C6F|nr:zinc finger protein-like 1 homolog [Condylostylus longicornis]
MGLCKCPKRQVTNQFCFEHCVNVCENCMVTSHPKCIVQSYLNWLKDSDYVSICSLCNGSLEDGDCVRLICYHIFHWNCLNERQSALLTTTTSGTHTCPICFETIFPPTNLVSPVADILRTKLKQVDWAKNDLGQITFSENAAPKSNSQIGQASQVTKIHGNAEKNKKNNGASTFYNNNNQIASNSPHSVLLMDAFNPPSTSADYSNSRRSLLSRQSSNGLTDRDDNKYRRRTPAEIFSRWSRRFYAPSSRPPWRRTWFLVLLGFLSFIIIVYVMAHFGRSSSSNESSDYWDNPNPKPMQVQNDHY